MCFQTSWVNITISSKIKVNQIHFLEFVTLDLNENYGQFYIRKDNIDTLCNLMIDKK
jgi:hypothetical protein